MEGLIRLSAAAAQHKLWTQIISKRMKPLKESNLNDEFVKFIEESFGEEDESPCYYELSELCANRMLIYYEWRDIPGELYDYLVENYEFYITGVMHIPELLPFVDEADFKQFVANYCAVAEGKDQNFIELAYLPTSQHTLQEEEGSLEFADQPATFRFGISDKNKIDAELMLDFFFTIIEFADGLQDYIDSKQVRGEQNDQSESVSNETGPEDAAA